MPLRRPIYIIQPFYTSSRGFVWDVFTGTIVESIVLKSLGAESLHDSPVKPISVTPIMIVDGRGGQLIVDGSSGPVMCEAPCSITFRVGVVGDELAMGLVDALGQIELMGERVEASQIEVRRVEPRRETTAFKVTFLTPTRFAVAPVPPNRRRQPKFEFAPYPLRLFKSIIRHGRELGLWGLGAKFLAWVHTYVYMEDFGCRGRSCVRTVKLSRGRVARGFVGWAIYTARSCRRLTSLWTALRVAEALNVGAGKSMGLGVIRVEPLTPRKDFCKTG